MKLVTPGDGAGSREAIGRSMAALGRIGHPVLVLVEAVLPAGQEAVALVSPLISGPSLTTALGRGTSVPVEEALSLGVVLAGASWALHRAGLVHGDLKPTNIFLRRGGQEVLGSKAVVSDAGLAGWVATTSRWGPALAGALEYLDPEVLGGGPFGTESDVYALGTILWELLAGRHPYRRSTGQQTLLAAARGNAPPLATAAPGVPSWLAQVVEEAMARRPADRPSHGGELLAGLAGGPGTRGYGPARPLAAPLERETTRRERVPAGKTRAATAGRPWAIPQLALLAVVMVLAGLAAVALVAGLGGLRGGQPKLTGSFGVATPGCRVEAHEIARNGTR
jgi:serine/threonine protein kinase